MQVGVQQTIISADDPKFGEYLMKMWRFRGMVLTLAKRDLRIKYAQTALGISWSVVQPLTALVVFTIFFGVLLDVEVGYPYALFVLSGVICWNLFIYIFTHGSNSLIDNQELIRKLSFPRIVLPISKVLVAFVETILTLLLMVPMIIWAQTPVSSNLIVLPFILIFVALFSLGVGLVLAAATLRYRDLHHIVPFLVNFGIWFTPVFYPVSLIPEQYSDLVYLNPMASLIELTRWSLFNDPVSPWAVTGLLTSVIVLVLGVIYFKRVEDSISELV